MRRRVDGVCRPNRKNLQEAKKKIGLQNGNPEFFLLAGQLVNVTWSC